MKSKKKPKKSYKRYYFIGTGLVALSLAGFVTLKNLRTETKTSIQTISASVSKPTAKKIQPVRVSEPVVEEKENTHSVTTRVEMFQPKNTTK